PRFRDYFPSRRRSFFMPSSACSSSLSQSARAATASSSASASPIGSQIGSSSAVGALPGAASVRGIRASLLCLILAGLLWGTGGLTGTLPGRAAGLPPVSVAALRLLSGGTLIVVFRVIPGRRWPAGRAAWTRVAVTGLLAATFQGAYFSAVSLTSVSLATLV